MKVVIHNRQEKKTGFTEEQIDAIHSWIEFAKGSLGDYIVDTEIAAVKKNLEADIRTHRHLENGEVTRPY